MKETLGRIVSFAVQAVLWLFVGAKTLLDLIGYSTVPDDTKVAGLEIKGFLTWLGGIPWPVTLGLATLLTALLIWRSWPRHAPITTQTRPAGPTPLKRNWVYPTREAAMAAVAPVKPLTPHAVEQKLKVIDRALDLMQDAGTFRDRLRVLFHDPWQTGTAPTSEGAHAFSDRIGVLREDVLKFFQRIEVFQNDVRAIYPDIAETLDRTDYQCEATERLAEYTNACREIEVLTSKGASINDVNFMYSQFVGRTERAVERILEWRARATNQLVKSRTSISPA